MTYNYNLHANHIQTATFGMGWFWGPDARFGHLPGVVRTRVGYTGGTTLHPTYRKIGDHSETLQIDFVPEIITYEEILHEFWKNHDAIKTRNYKGRQYLSILLYHDENQKEAADRIKREWERHLNSVIQTEIQAFSTFYLAEDYHQKYYLKRFARATESIQSIFPNHEAFVHSTVAARLNGFVKGYGKMINLKKEIENWGLQEEEKQDLLHHLLTIKW